MGVSAEELSGVELGEIAEAGLPAPRGEMWGVGFVGGEAVPALEDLLAGIVVPRSPRGVVDPCSVGVVAGTAVVFVFLDLERGKGVVGGGGRFELGEKEENGNEAENRQKRNERDFLLCDLQGTFPCGHGSSLFSCLSSLL